MTDLNAALRSTQQQLKDELESTYKRMTDPAEQEQARLRQERSESLADLATDTGL